MGTAKWPFAQCRSDDPSPWIGEMVKGRKENCKVYCLHSTQPTIQRAQKCRCELCATTHYEVLSLPGEVARWEANCCKKAFTEMKSVEQRIQERGQVIAHVQHLNVVNLLGYCIHGQEKLFVYEYVSHESLDMLLFRFDCQRSSMGMSGDLNIYLECDSCVYLYLHMLAMTRLNTSVGILDVMGAPLTWIDLRAYVMSRGGIAVKHFKQAFRSI